MVRSTVDETIHYSLGLTSLGRVLTAWSRGGVCAVLLGEDALELEAELRSRFRRAELIETTAPRSQALNWVTQLIDVSGLPLDLPIDMRGTAFQQKVWQALRTIPVGQIVTYAEVARSIGNPQAYRAVASACGANPLAVVIPCHRVVRSDGKQGAYRWGIEKKQWLLARENAVGTSPSLLGPHSAA